MSSQSPLQVPGEKLRKAIADFAEKCRQCPEMKKSRILADLQIKYDLSPLECQFLEKQLLE